MAGMADMLARRFGDGGASAKGAEDNELMRRVLTRKTVRRYSDKMPSEDLLDLLTACALSASAKSDFQQASILRLRNPERRAAIGALFPGMPWIGNAPVFLVFCGDARRLERLGELRGHTADNGRLEGFFNAAIDAALVLQTFILAAETAGLGCCPISVIRNHSYAVAEILDLPDKVFPVAGLCVGYPAAAGHLSMRLPLDVTLHADRYEDSLLGEAVDAYDRRRDARYSIPREQQRSPEIFGYASHYGWSEDKARQVTQPEGQDFSAYLSARGFSME